MKYLKNKPTNRQGKVFLMLLIVLLTPVLVFGADFDNSKGIINVGKGHTLTIGDKELAYNSLWEKYKPIEIKNWFGIGETLMTGAITENTETCGSSCSSEMEIYIANNGTLIDDVRFMELQEDGGWINKPIKNYQFYLKILEDNNYTYKEYELGEELKAGTYTIQLGGEKEIIQTIDWQITSQGKLIDDWVIWNATFEIGCDKADSDYEPSGFFAQTFTAPTTGNITTIGFYWREYVNLHTCELYINSTSGTNPAGSLYHGSIDPNNIQADTGNNCNNMIWENFTISPAVDVIAGTKYFVSVRCYQADGGVGGILFWGYNRGGGWANAERETSTDYSSWNVQTNDFLMGVWGGGLPDTTAPLIQIFIPIGIINYGSSSENLSWNVTDLYLQSIWYNYDGTNRTLYGAVNSTIFNLSTSPYNLTLYANDSFGNTNSSYIEWSYVLFGNSASYNPSTIATTNESFGININYNSSNWISAGAYLNYNGTNYLSTKTLTTDNLIFNNSFIVPNPTTSTNYNFFWNISLTNTTGNYYITTTNYTQSVNPLQAINITSSVCDAGFSSAFNFTSLIESNLTTINFGTVNYNLQYGSSGNVSALVSYGTFTNIPAFSICINTTSSYWVGYGEIQYQVTGYSNRRFYIFQNSRLLNITFSNNLYSLETASSTPFQITATNTALIPYDGYYISLLRWYPDLNTYKIVDMGKTDSQGQTVLNVKTNDVDYRLGLYAPDGTLIKLLNPIRMVCQTTPCIYSLIVDLSELDLTTFLNIQSELTYDATTKVFSYIYNDPSQDTTLMNLTVWKDYPDKNSEIICTNSATGFTGILVCDVSDYSGQLRAEVWRYASPKILIAQLFASIKSALIDTANGKFIGLFIGLILVISMALMGTVSPPLAIILSVVALIPLVFLGVIDKAIFLIIGAIAGIILHFLRRIS